ncbi:phage head-tail adapter protein [Enterococcus sp. JM9B]|uniref:phage head-tail adapter protein n=1 Tax=Enterococcus sp. JM9B TaxID=1857216 RepID=UPI001374CFDD|nr:phage head-tail adapter protein [Enterococcus sp. JM9B]KAF1303669.1 phage head-tail adapter protein [Enterococcus sp. JM9B]
MIHSNYKPPEIGTGDLKTPVSFFEYAPSDGPEPDEVVKKNLYSCTALIYNPSMKDMTILEAKGTKEGVTIKIRDPYLDYVPTNKHKVEIDDYRYVNKKWEIIDVALDFENNAFVKIILGATS